MPFAYHDITSEEPVLFSRDALLNKHRRARSGYLTFASHVSRFTGCRINGVREVNRKRRQLLCYIENDVRMGCVVHCRVRLHEVISFIIMYTLSLYSPIYIPRWQIQGKSHQSNDRIPHLLLLCLPTRIHVESI
jgi:hypothetical protein